MTIKQDNSTYFWPELISGKLIKRYKRFLADVELENGAIVTAHCSNTGTMKECSDPGSTVYLSYHDNPKRKLKYTWELIKMPLSLVGVNTLVPNRLVKIAAEACCIKELQGYQKIKSEVNTGQGSRLDLMLEKDSGEKCFVEIKNCTLVINRKACFPDAVTERGRKHLVELQRLKSMKNRAIIFFLIQRMDAKIFSPADHIDPQYGLELRKAVKNGVEILAYDVIIDLQKIVLGKKIPLDPIIFD